MLSSLPSRTSSEQQSQQAGFAANNANASGANDPDGSRRFNIFLARTVDPTGRPQIMGTIAPPQAGNLFPGECVTRFGLFDYSLLRLTRLH